IALLRSEHHRRGWQPTNGSGSTVRVSRERASSRREGDGEKAMQSPATTGRVPQSAHTLSTRSPLVAHPAGGRRAPRACGSVVAGSYFMSAEFAHLHVHTQYSMLDGAVKVKDLVKKVAGLGMKAVAVTDHGNMFGAISFYKAAKEAKVQAILGCE